MSGATDSARFLLALVADAGECFVYFWPVSVSVLSVSLVVLTVRPPFRDPRFRGRLWLFAISYGFPLVVLLIGTLLRYDGPPHPNWREPPAWRGWTLLGAMVLHVILSITSIVLMKGARVRSAAALLPAVWLSFCAYVPSGFGVAGVGP
jgi:hypothetical protein